MCCSIAIHSNHTFSQDETEQPTTEELLAHPEVKSAINTIDAWVDGVRIYKKIPGISVGIVRDQDLIWSKGFGYSNLETKRPADGNTIYSICSISKLFTSIAVMQLRDAIKLRLRDPVADHLEWFDVTQTHSKSGPITVEGLLAHFSGLPRESDFSYWTGPDFPFPTREQMIEKLEKQETLYSSQHLFQYSNLGFALAGEIVQSKSGQEYRAYIKQKILDPLALSDTRTFYPEDLRGAQMAIGYSGMDRSGTREQVDCFCTRALTSAAGFTSSVNDLAKFASWQFRLLENGGEEILTADTLREMHRIHWLQDDEQVMRGLGFSINKVDKMMTVGHGGGCPGYITNFLIYPKQKIAIIVLTNASDGPAAELTNNILKTISPALKKAEKPSEVEIPDYSMYEGNYESRPWGGEVAIRQAGDHLVAITLPSDDLKKATKKLKHVEGHKFVRLTDEDEPRESVVFELGDNGKARRYLQHSNYRNRIESTN